MSIVKSLFIAVVGLLSAVYLANIGVGVIEFIPDNLPVVGNIDEALATLLLLNSLAYFGINLRSSQQHSKNANKAVDSTTTRVTTPASSLRSGQESRHEQP